MAALLAATCFLTIQSAANAGLVGTVFTETTDAGQTLPTATSTAAGTAGTSLTEILGTFNGATDADLYAISLTSPSTFAATTNNSATTLGGQDTEISLFNASGAPIAVNDDASGATTNSTLPAGNSLYASLPAGTYFLAIAEAGNEAINSSLQNLFLPYPGGDTTAVRGRVTLLNPAVLGTFNGNTFTGGGTGAYEIDLTSVSTAFNPFAVPEPSTWSALALGSIAAGFAILRRRRAA